jgi:hypothetical protein
MEMSTYIHSFALLVRAARDKDPEEEYDFLIKDFFVRSLANPQITRQIIKRMGPDLPGSLQDVFRKAQEIKHEFLYLDGICEKNPPTVKSCDLKVAKADKPPPKKPKETKKETATPLGPPGLICYHCGEQHFRAHCPLLKKVRGLLAEREKKVAERRKKKGLPPKPPTWSDEGFTAAKVALERPSTYAGQGLLPDHRPGYQLASSVGQQFSTPKQVEYYELLSREFKTKAQALRDMKARWESRDKTRKEKGGYKGKPPAEGKKEKSAGKPKAKEAKKGGPVEEEEQEDEPETEDKEEEDEGDEVEAEGEEDEDEFDAEEDALDEEFCEALKVKFFDALLDQAQLFDAQKLE